jgi:hypothetical protein
MTSKVEKRHISSTLHSDFVIWREAHLMKKLTKRERWFLERDLELGSG